MKDFKKRYCRLCLITINGKNYETIENITKEVLSVLLVNLDLVDYSEHVMCHVCSKKLYGALKFKSMCLDTDDTIFPHVDDAKSLPIDLKDVYKFERGNKRISDNVKICRLCMRTTKSVSEFTAISEEQVAMIHKFVPEMDVFTIKEPVVCRLCLDSLAVHSNFLKECLGVKVKISDGEIPDGPSSASSLDTSLKIEDVDINFEYVQQSTPMVCTDTYSEEIKTESEIHAKSEVSICNHKVSPNNANVTKDTEYSCNYKNKNKGYFKKPLLIHKNYSGRQIYRCEACYCEVKYKSLLKIHMLKHKEPSEVQMYKCANCDYETKVKGSLKIHIMLKHKEPSELQMYKCVNCNYETKLKGNLKTHMLRHKKPSEVQMYKCVNCNYETEVKGNLKKHMLKHSEPSEVQTYKCECCNYESRYKTALKRHLLIHKDPSELQMYKCEYCNYEAKSKQRLKIHGLKHKKTSEVQMYKCANCDFETKVNRSLKIHIMLKHKEPSELQMYKCVNCHYETKLKGSLKIHMLRHRKPSEMQM